MSRQDSQGTIETGSGNQNNPTVVLRVSDEQGRATQQSTHIPSSSSVPMCDGGGKDHCSLHTRFRLRNGIVNVVSCDDDVPGSRRFTETPLDLTKPVNIVLLGSPQHLMALKERLLELQGNMMEVMRENQNGGLVPGQPEANQKKLESIRKEVEQRSEELIFLEANSASKEESIDSDIKSETLEESSTLASGEELTSESGLSFTSGASTANSGQDHVIHVTSDTFGALQKLRIIEHKHHEHLFRVPKVRQYFMDNVMHREKEERKVSWDELFVDLIYVGAVAKAAHHIAGTGTWIGFRNFALVMISIIQHWRSFSMHSNTILHEDLFYRILTFVAMSGLVIMGLTTEHAFDSSSKTNTSNIFLAAYLISKGSFALTVLFVAKIASHVRSHLLLNAVGLFTSIVPAAIFVALPMDGTTSRDTAREALWWLACCTEFIFWLFAPLIGKVFFKFKNFVAINIEHLTERHGLLVVIVLGEVIVSLLYDHSSSIMSDDIFVILLGLLIGTNISSLYFRAEGKKHFLHALRRHWITGVSWTALHVPLCLSIAGLGGTMNRMIQIETAKTSDTKGGYATTDSGLSFELRSLFVVLLALIYVCLGTFVWCHHDVDPSKVVYKKSQKKGGKRHAQYQLKANLTQVNRAVIKYISAALALVIGLSIPQYDCKSLLGFGAALTSVSVLLDEWGRLRQRRCSLDPRCHTA